MTVIGPSTGEALPTNPVFSYTDHGGVTVDEDKARWLRPLEYGEFNEFTPHARARFRSDAPSLTIRLNYNNRYTGSYYYDIVSVFVDGAFHSDHDPADSRTQFYYDITLNFGSSDMRTIEVIMPYCASVEFTSVIQNPKYRMTRCQPRPSKRLLTIGDSITNIFYATSARLGYPFVLANLLNAECLNMGFAGADSSSHGAAEYMEELPPFDIVTIMLGVNDAAAAMAEATFKSNYTTLLEGVLSNLGSEARVFCITPIWANWPPELNLADYRTWVIDVAIAVDDPRVTAVDGLTLCSNTLTSVPDGVHPGDIGHTEIAANLYNIIEA